jgi:hypothetical protein
MEMQLEKMRATFYLKEDKLDYEGRVLRERTVENAGTLTQQKRRIAQVKDSLSCLKVLLECSLPFATPCHRLSCVQPWLQCCMKLMFKKHKR